MKQLIWLAFFLLIVIACSTPPTAVPATAVPPTSVPATAAPTSVPPTAVPPTTIPPTTAPTATAPVPASPTAAPTASQPAQTSAKFPAQPLESDRGKLFSASGQCSSCHTNLVDEAQADVSIDTAWRATTKANAARDPYWKASVRAEGLENPGLAAVIEDKCATCHMPMARTTDAAAGGKGKVLDDGYGDAKNPLHSLAIDGISCTLCHQIKDTNLGKAASNSGGYVVDKQLATGERLNYGPNQVAPTDATLMQGASGFKPVQSAHIKESGLCGTCHDLRTPFVDDNGKVAGDFPEQMPFTEWQNSDYAQKKACPDCHMPQAKGAARSSTMGSAPPRSPFFQHTFIGGNIYTLQLLMAGARDLELTASSDQFQATIKRTADLLQTNTATVALENGQVDNGKLSFDVTVANLAGHKFPTSFPSRRAWLHITVKDAAGKVIFESGAYEPNGAISGNDNDADATKYEPHYAQITAPDQVQIYEAIMGTTSGQVTTVLLRGAKYLKDNRLLPAGFKTTTNPDIAVVGAAAQDKNFQAGGDRVNYLVGVGSAKGPFTVSAELLYQAIGYRSAQNLKKHTATEVMSFLQLYDAVPNLPTTVASKTLDVK